MFQKKGLTREKQMMDIGMIFHSKILKDKSRIVKQNLILFIAQDAIMSEWRILPQTFEGFVAVFLDIYFLIYNTLTISAR